MADKQTERALRSQRERHEGQIRQCAERISEYAGYILRKLDAGEIPGGFDLVADAVEINQRVFALEAIKARGDHCAACGEAGDLVKIAHGTMVCSDFMACHERTGADR